MYNKRDKAHGKEVPFSAYLYSLVKPWFTTGEYAMEAWTGEVELKPVNNVLAIYVENEQDFDLAVSILDKHFSEEKKDIEIRFFDRVENLKN